MKSITTAKIALNAALNVAMMVAVVVMATLPRLPRYGMPRQNDTHMVE
jgi:hypothetical protein